MNIYQNMRRVMEDNAHLISMVPVEELLRFGYEIGLKPGMKVLDLCCGYGTVLKIWRETFDIYGVGVDREKSFLDIGTERLEKQGIDNVLLVHEDVTKYQDETQYDVVICSETIDSIENTFLLGKKFLKPGGTLCYQKLYAKVSEPPQELIDFDGEVLPLSALNRCFNDLGWYMTAMASDTPGMWEHYVVNWCGKRLWEEGADPAWIKTWYDMYFDYRRQYEGQALFGLREIKEMVK